MLFNLSNINFKTSSRNVTMDTLALKLTVPTTKPVVDFHHQVVAHARHTKRGFETPPSFYMLFYVLYTKLFHFLFYVLNKCFNRNPILYNFQVFIILNFLIIFYFSIYNIYITLDWI